MLALMLSLGLLVAAQDSAYGCEFQAEFRVGMTESAGTDILIVETIGEHCETATVLVRLTGARQLVFADAFPAANLHSSGRPTREEVREAVGSGIFIDDWRDATDLPEIPDIAQSKLRTDGPIPRWQPLYKRARQNGGALVCWRFRLERQRCAWWDREERTGHILFEAGY